ncbi:hypothetical protein [Aquimarina sp. 2201CG14-23]|uniref:hypothetical protein n=1 Tax=Aquimarina mycalae TaxID=3040073 RepID=UPI0024781D44|nr:hypothetical protein [Aquimarina sp. 2201CG14-23]MDH7448230.1 hypothetical protein [Aquimarina sp. 2201CG14-23]
MKKLILIFVLILISQTSCSSDDDNIIIEITDPTISSEPIIGTWQVTKITINGMEESLDCNSESITFINNGNTISKGKYKDIDETCNSYEAMSKWEKVDESNYKINAIIDDVIQPDIFVEFKVNFTENNTKASFIFFIESGSPDGETEEQILETIKK